MMKSASPHLTRQDLSASGGCRVYENGPSHSFGCRYVALDYRMSQPFTLLLRFFGTWLCRYFEAVTNGTNSRCEGHFITPRPPSSSPRKRGSRSLCPPHNHATSLRKTLLCLLSLHVDSDRLACPDTGSHCAREPRSTGQGSSSKPIPGFPLCAGMTGKGRAWITQ